MIAINQVSHGYKFKNSNNYVNVLNNLKCHVNDNEFVSFVGKSGCGKSTLINIIAGYIKPRKGNILVDGNYVREPGRNRIVVNQENDLFDWLTIYENISLVCKDSKKIDHLLYLMKIERFKDNYPPQLSSGMRKRLSIARALAVNPEILLLDEPFGSLDYFTKETLQIELLKLLKTEYTTVLLVTHDVDEAVFMSDRVIVLSGEPTSFKKMIAIPFEHPRSLKIKESELFSKVKHEIRSNY